MTGLQFYKKRTHLSISSLTACARCPRRYFYSSGCRLGSSHGALEFGTAIHAALGPTLDAGLDAGIEAFDKAWDKKWDDDKRNRQRALVMLMHFYNCHLPGQSLYKLLAPPANAPKIQDRVSQWEIPFALDIGLDVPLVGRIDGWASHRDTGELWAVEFKTSSELSTRFMQSFTLNPQAAGYTLALRTLSGKTVRGTMVEGLLVSKGVNSNTLIQPVHIQDHHLEAFVKWAKFWGSLILEMEKTGDFPKWYSGCTPYPMFGTPGYSCDYDKLCMVEDWTSLKDIYGVREDRPFILSSEQPVHPVTVPLTVGGEVV